MKKVLLILGILMVCGFTPQVGKKYNYTNDGRNYSVNGNVVEVDGMRILILCKDGYENSPCVINLTKDKIQIEKDKLEIELLKRQLDKK